MAPHEPSEMVAPYVVDALSAEEAAEFERHLEGCPDCRSEVAEMRTLTALMSQSVEAEPPQSLRRAVLASIAVTEQEPAETSARTPPAAPVDRAPVGAPDNVVPLRDRTAARVAYLVAAAAVVAAVALGGWALQSRHDAQQAGDRQQALISLLGAGDVRTASGTATGGGSGTVVLSSRRDQVVFIATGLPRLPAGRTYELWTITDRPTPAGTFAPSGGGQVVTLPAAALAAAQIAVTVEPEGGSDQPTTPPVLAVRVPQPS